MNSVLGNPWIIIPVVSALVGLVAYLWSDKVIGFLRNKSLGSREEILRYLDLMFVETDKQKVTTLLLLLSFGVGIIVFVLLLPNFLLGLLFGALVTMLGWMVPARIVKNLWEKRCGRFVEQMVDGLTIMANGINSGLTVTQAMERVVENLANPISQEFGLVLSQIALGRNVEESLVELGERIPRPDVTMFVTAINILKETGGNLPETFATIVVTIRERQKIEKKIEAMTAQGVMQGIIVSMVPFILLVVFMFIDPGFISPMFNTALGLILLFVMLIFVILGGLAIRKIVTINV